jgi:hypothetical protein
MSRQPLSRREAEEYLDSGGDRCPVCGSDHYEAGCVEIDGSRAWQRIVCDKCAATWDDIYVLSAVELVEDPILITPEIIERRKRNA